MRIAILMLSAPPKRFIGAEKYDLELARFLRAKGHDVSIYLSDHPGESWEYDGFAFNSPVSPAEVLISHADLITQAKEFNKLVDAPARVAIVHNEQPGTLKSTGDSFWTGVIYNSHWIKSKGHFTGGEENELVLYPPVNVKLQKSISKGKKALKIGLNMEKGAGDLFFLALYGKEHDFLGVKAGWGAQQDGQLSRLKNIEIIDHQSDLHEVYKQASCILILSSFESWSMVATEAMAYGVPTITYDRLPGVVENIGDSGYVVGYQDIHSILKLLKEVKPSRKVQARFKELKKITASQLEQVSDYIERPKD